MRKIDVVNHKDEGVTVFATVTNAKVSEWNSARFDLTKEEANELLYALAHSMGYQWIE